MIELLERLGYYPRFCVWELTLTCDLRCKHCGSHAGTRRKDELSYEECLDVADALAAMNCEKVTLGGGEPTLHPRWHELGKRLTDQGVRVNMISNGWGWSDKHLQRSREAGLANVAFSLDGFEEAHDAVRRKDSFRRVVAAIDQCVSDGMPTSIVSHINALNYKQLPEFRDFLGEQGVASWQLQLGVPSGDMRANRELVIEPAELLWLIPQIAELRTDEVERPKVCPSDNIGYFGKYEKALRDRGAEINFWIGCRAGCQVIGIESNGNIKGCLSLPSAMHGQDQFLEGNLRDEKLIDIWQRPDAFKINRGFTEDQLGGFCAKCRYRDICRGGCAWTAYSHTSNRFDNPYCFYRQAVLHNRLDLLGDDEPNAEELAYEPAADPGPPVAIAGAPGVDAQAEASEPD
ncbi:MAG: radical SAM/SPASM domain-containing protein [Deltaproteobacteria bacterium]|nr:MAG: radical SAM/SPASM domain-containing protein [Deltaproteobacteria bacterium]